MLSVKDRLHREHMVAVAEVAHQDTLNLARLGLAMVGSDGKHVGQTLDRIVAKLRQLTDAELGDVSRQVLEASQIESDESDDDDNSESSDDTDTLAAELIARAESLMAEHQHIVNNAASKAPTLNSPTQVTTLADAASLPPGDSTFFSSPRRHNPHTR